MLRPLNELSVWLRLHSTVRAMTAAPICCCSKKRRRQAGDDDAEGSNYEDTLDEEADGSGNDSDASDLASGTIYLEQTTVAPSGLEEPRGSARGQH